MKTFIVQSRVQSTVHNSEQIYFLLCIFDVKQNLAENYDFLEQRKIIYSFVYVIGLHAVQFGNNWMKKIPRTAKIGRGRRPRRVQFGCQRNSLNLIISKLDKHVVLLPINYIASQSIQRKRLFLVIAS